MLWERVGRRENWGHQAVILQLILRRTHHSQQLKWYVSISSLAYFIIHSDQLFKKWLPHNRHILNVYPFKDYDAVLDLYL